MIQENKDGNKERPFEGKKIYYSGSIAGVLNTEPDFGWNLVQWMIANGADVLSEHVAGRDEEEREDVFLKRTGVDRRKVADPEFITRHYDLKMVDEASHLIAVVNGPSHGVGMEIQRAVDKPRLGLNETPILALVHKDAKDKLTWMISGIRSDESSGFRLADYSDLEDAKGIIKAFLSNH